MDFKWFNYTKNKYRTEFVLLGFKIFEEYRKHAIRIQYYFGTLFWTKKLYSLKQEKKIFKILDYSIAERTTNNGVTKYKLLGLPIINILLLKDFYKHLQNIKFDYDDVYIINGNSGETYLFFAYCVNATLKKNNSKNPFFVATEKYHLDILKMYLPNAHCVYIENFDKTIKNDRWTYKNHNFYMIFSPYHFYKVEKYACLKNKGELHYLDCIKSTLGILEEDYSVPVVKTSKETEKSLSEKIKSINLNTDNFVIFAPEAKTCEELPISLWENLFQQLQQKGFDVFLNIIDKSNIIEGCKSAYLNYEEVFLLASKAKAVISLRSGFTEFLIPANIPNITIYTKFKNRKKFPFSVEKTISAFTMHKFPFVNHELICELNIDNYADNQQLLMAITDNLEKRLTREVQFV